MRREADLAFARALPSATPSRLLGVSSRTSSGDGSRFVCRLLGASDADDASLIRRSIASLSQTLWIGTLIGIVAHIILIIAAIPSVIAGGHAIAPFIIALLTLALASGLIKPTVSPLIADQAPIARQTISTLPSGERVILDPSQTLQRALLIFYWCVAARALSDRAHLAREA